MKIDAAKRQVGKGWSGLIDELYEIIDGQEDCILSIKEKYGVLRIDIYGVDDETLDKISELEDRSGTMCEECGEKGETEEGPGGWIKTSCKKHKK